MRDYPRRWIVYDCETDSRPVPGDAGRREMRFRLGCAAIYDVGFSEGAGPAFMDFHDTDAFHGLVRFVVKTAEPLWIFAHNHAFDARIVGFFERLALGEYSLLPPEGVKRRGAWKDPLFVIDGRPFLLRLWRPDGQQLILSDLGNWLDTSLAKIGDMLGRPKGTIDFNSCTDAELMDYCRNDVEITDLALRRVWAFCRSIGVKHWQPTLASQAYQSFARRYSKRTIKVPDDPDVLTLDRHAYYGGRQEAFRLGRIEGPVVQVDVNSMYPSLMKDGLFPVAVEEDLRHETLKTAGAPPHPAQTTAEVWLDSPDVAYPVRCRDGVWYCRGKVRTILCGPELRSAVERGHVAFFARRVRYRMSRLFTAFVRDLWGVRLGCRGDGDAVGDKLSKMMMDALYGKFGQRSGEWITLGQDYPQDHYGQGVVVTGLDNQTVDWRTIAGIYQRRTRDTLAPHAFVPIAAYVTSYGRVFMDSVRSKLWEGGTYYQATDCLLVDVGNYDMLDASGLLNPGELGSFRIEGTWEWIDVKGLNHIERSHRPVRGGVPDNATPVGPSAYAFERWEGAWAGILAGRPSSASTKQTCISLSSSYTRQESLGNGCLQPWAISNWHLTPERQARESILTHRD